jgi:hypothetical protein
MVGGIRKRITLSVEDVLPGLDHGIWQVDIWISQEAPRYSVAAMQYAGLQ